ncbi:hypothetical protein THIOM_001236 [Candidatus Thiomargarita nelsonii]|uniref:Uncharacterized protein n=1 Tax=Candidatus Thiomargarita nelsonii TaxID=1003181 RepID=A0A176S4A1_9GAMM|nr:hypothetical protein THIOM_001236 [Candidatus Thiomargarita nelsonii]
MTLQPGFELFKTAPGAEVDLGCAGVIPLEGNPALLASENIGLTDTIIKRQQGIDPFNPGDTGTVLVEMVALSLKSIDPFNAGCLGHPSMPEPTMVDLYVTVNTDLVDRPDLPQPDALTASTGTMNINHENLDTSPLQGTFNNILDVYADLIFVQPGGDVGNPVDWITSMPDPDVPLVLTSNGYWSHEPQQGDKHNESYPAGQFYIAIDDDEDPTDCQGEPTPCFEHTGPHPIEPTLVTLVDGSFAATASNGAVTIAWETASEIDNAGFFVWRGQLKADKTECSLNGEDYTEVKKISPFILAQGSGAYYSYEDRQVASRNSYCYVLEDIDLADKSTYHLDDISSVQ